MSKLFAITVEGTTPLLLHRFTDEAQISATEGTAVSTVGDRGTPHEQASMSLYLHDDTEVMPGPNLFRCIIDAGKFFRTGRVKVTTVKTSLLPSCLSVNEIIIPICSSKGWTVDSRPVRIPSTGGRIIRHRPMFHDWRLSFGLTLDETIISAKLLREIVDAAGTRIGLGDFRPTQKGLLDGSSSWRGKRLQSNRPGKAGHGRARHGRAR